MCTDQCQCITLVETPNLPMLSALMFVVPYTMFVVPYTMFVVPYTDNVHTTAMKEQTIQT